MTPWCQIKVGFDASELLFEDEDRAFAYCEDIKDAFPKGWVMNETYSTPIAFIIIFEVEGAVTIADGETVETLLRAYTPKKRKKAPRKFGAINSN